ncbi:PepSY-associated TM helix domain-containing protein [Thermogutta sp.]|uniref:PepSY-associated TM helix domain-containing protein n=1 Tax=Thermogutta sp. TaxID=1962930 RepID=UPI003C79A6AC
MFAIIRTLSRPLRQLHRWIGLALMIPLLSVAVTGILLIHPNWYESRKVEELPPSPPPPREIARVIATALDDASKLEGFHIKQIDVRFHPSLGWFVNVKGVHRSTARERQYVHPVAATTSQTMGKSAQQAILSEPPPKLGLKKFFKDLHTGEIFGKEWAWIWADLVGFSLAFLACSGLIIYLPVFWAKRKRNTNRVLAGEVQSSIGPFKSTESREDVSCARSVG